MAEISVIIPVYQAEPFLKTCLDSVVHQTFEDWELLLIDDGSRDRSGDICEEYKARDSRIRVFHQANAGVSAARNRGLSEAAAPHVAFLDADDSWEPEMLETLLTLCREHNADTAACGVTLWEADGSSRTEAPLKAGTLDAAGIRQQILLPLMGQRLCPPIFNGYIFRYLFDRQRLETEKLRFYGGYLEDELFLLEYFRTAERVAVTEKSLYHYMQNPASATHRYMKDFPGVFRAFMERKTAFAEKAGLTEITPDWRENSQWAGLLIAVGNVYAPGNPDPAYAAKRREVKALCALPEYRSCMEKLRPVHMGRRKQLVAELLLRRQFRLLGLLYRVKNAKRGA